MHPSLLHPSLLHPSLLHPSLLHPSLYAWPAAVRGAVKYNDQDVLTVEEDEEDSARATKQTPSSRHETNAQQPPRNERPAAARTFPEGAQKPPRIHYQSAENAPLPAVHALRVWGVSRALASASNRQRRFVRVRCSVGLSVDLGFRGVGAAGPPANLAHTTCLWPYDTRGPKFPLRS